MDTINPERRREKGRKKNKDLNKALEERVRSEKVREIFSTNAIFVEPMKEVSL